MKKSIQYSLLIMSILLYTFNTADAQHKTSKKHSHKSSHTTSHSKATTSPAKSIDDGTTGVMGKDTVKMNNKGMQRNMNANTGVPLPPNSGTGTKK